MSNKTNEVYEFGEFRLHPQARSLERNDVPIVLNRRAFDVLLYLVQHPGRVVSKEELLKNVWVDAFVDENNLSQSISALRRSLQERPGTKGLIATVPGRGYQFLASVRGPERFEGGDADGTGGGAVILEQHTVTTSVVTEQRRRPGVWLVAGIAAMLLLTGAAGWWHKTRVPEDHHELVLADFENDTGDPAFDVVLRNGLEIALEQSPVLVLTSPSQVRAMLQQMEEPVGTRLTPVLAREVCARAHAQAFLSGTIHSLGKSYVLSLAASDCVAGKRFALLQKQVADKETVLDGLSDLSTEMRGKLGESLRSVETYDVPLTQATTSSFEALVAYSHVDNLEPGKALPYLQRALELDPKFALATSGMAFVYSGLGDQAKVKEYVARAYALRQGTSAAEQFYLTEHYDEIVLTDMDAALHVLDLWSQAYPRQAKVWGTLGNAYTQIGRYPEAIAAAKRGVEADPNADFSYVILARAYKRNNQFAEAKAVCEQGLKLRHHIPGCHSLLLQIAVAENDGAGMARETVWDKGQPSESETLNDVAWMYATQGRLHRMMETFAQARAVTRANNVDDSVAASEGDEAVALALLGEREASIKMIHGLTNLQDVGSAASEAEDAEDLRRAIGELERTAPVTSTLIRKMQLPYFHAALDGHEHAPGRGMTDLEPERPYELVDYYAMSLRGRLLLAGHDGAGAEGEFEMVLRNPGVDPISPLGPLAELGVARALAEQGKVQASREAYEKLFVRWRDADADVPVLVKARAEYAGLGGR